MLFMKLCVCNNLKVKSGEKIQPVKIYVCCKFSIEEKSIINNSIGLFFCGDEKRGTE